MDRRVVVRALVAAGVLLVAAAAGCGSDDQTGVGGTGAGGAGGSGAQGGSGAIAGAGGAGAAGGSAGAGAGLSPHNEGSPLGTNLSGVRDWSHEWSFVDAFKASRDWISGDANNWDNGASIDVDADGWVKSLAPGQLVRTLLFWGMDGAYPSGQYLVIYQGQGTMDYWSAATLDAAASTPGRDVIDVDASQGGIGINITAIDAGDPLRNIRVIMPGGACDDDALRYCDDATPCASGSCQPFEQSYATQIFHPIFLDRIKTYRVLRFMDWMDTNGSDEQSWSGRPKLSDARWSTHGVPAEILVDLANRLHADPWFNVPHLADDDYVSALATLARDTLTADLTVYIEHSNEVWNSMFAQADHAQQRGLQLGLSNDPNQARLYYHSQRSVEIFGIWQTVFGGTDRLVRVMGSQAASTWVSEQVLDFKGAAASTDALGIAPYFGGYLGSPSQQVQVAAMSLDQLFADLQSNGLPTAAGWVADQKQVADARGVRLIAYEGGQHLAGHGGVENDDVINALFDAANRDSRMGQLYAVYLDAWKSNGGELMAHFINCSGYSKWGRWGSLELLDQPRAAAPKFDALQTFIESNPAWW